MSSSTQPSGPGTRSSGGSTSSGPDSSSPNSGGPASSSPASSRWKRVIRLLIVSAVLLFFLWYALGGVSWSQLREALASANILWIVAAVAASIGSHLARAQRWRILIPRGEEIGRLNAFSATIIGYMMNNIIPRSGEIARPYVLAKRERRSFSSLVATVVVERIIDGLTLASLTGLLLIIEHDRIDQLLPGYSAADILTALAVPLLALVVLVAVALRTSMGDRLLDLLARWIPERIIRKMREILRDFRGGVTFGGAGGTSRILLWTLAIWTGYALVLYFCFIAFGFDRSHDLGAGATLLTLAVTTIAFTIAPTPGAFGVYHAFCRAALVTLYGIPEAQAVAFALVAHGAPYLGVMAVGAIFAFRENLSLGDAAEAGRSAGQEGDRPPTSLPR